ncbi:MAG TPA: MetQ/NlpA family ABC transporter substrate-binding protein [Symbiobacteriaceae bacterium]
MKRITSLLLAVTLAAGVVAGCSKPRNAYNQPNEEPGDTTPVTLVIGQMPAPDGLPFWIAEAKGYFEQQGVHVELKTFKSANERDAALMAGEIDGMLADPLAAATLYAAGTKVKIVSLGLGATPEEGLFGIVSAPGSGITEVSQLKGVEIANSQNTISHYVMEQLLLDAGLQPEDIRMVSIPSVPLRYEAVMSGQVQAALLPDPLMTLAKASGEGATLVIHDGQTGKNYSQTVIVFTEKAIQEKRDGIRRMLLAYNAGVADLKLDPDRYLDLMVEKANLPVAAKIAYAGKGVPFSFAQAPKKEDLERVIQWLLDKQVIDTPLTYEELVDTSMLPNQPEQ